MPASPLLVYGFPGAGSGSGVEDEGEEPEEAGVGVLHVHEQGGVEDAVPLVVRFVREIELGGQDRLVGRLDLDVDVPRAAGIEPGQNRLQLELALVAGELVAAA